MATRTERTMALAQLEERLRQERETFDLRKVKDQHSFRLRMVMGWIACAMLPTVAAACFLVLYFHERFTEATVVLAGGTILADVVGVVVAVWRAFAGDKPEALTPVTKPGT